MNKLFKTLIAAALCAVLIISCTFSLFACTKPDNSDLNDDTILPQAIYQKNTDLDTSKEVSLRIVGSAASWAELDNVIAGFTAIYPNCSIEYEQIEDYNATLETRLQQSELGVDIFITVNIQADSDLKSYALNLISEDSKKILDLSGCNEGLVENYRFTSLADTQYAVPIGGLMRGMFVNKTLLAKYNLKTPTNKNELLNCCKVLTENGHIAMQSPAENLGQQLLYPSMCNRIANADNYPQTWQAVQNCEDNISELFREDYELYYDMIRLGYVNFSTNGKGKELLNLQKQADGTYVKIDDVGNIGFVVDTQAMALSLDKDIADYHSQIEYEFVASPVGDDGGYAYLSPADGFAINRSTPNPDWALEFLNYFFSPEINTAFSEASGQIANTKDAMLKFNISADRMSTVGQVTFDYGDAPNFYNTVTMLTRNGYSYDRYGSFTDTYASVNANYRSVFPNQTYYRKLEKATYEPVDAAFAAANPKTVYKYELDTYAISDEVFYAAHPDETYYRKVTHVAVDADYIAENPTQKLYRRIEPIEGMAFMRVQDKNGNFVKNADGTYQVKYTLDEYMERLENEFQIAKAYKFGAK